MSINLTIARLPADKEGDDIYNTLLTDKASATSRGIREIDYYASKKLENANCPLHDSMETGILVQVSKMKEIFKGKVTFFSQTITIDQDSRTYLPTTSLKIERKNEDF